jgi:hypothetical protein
MLPAASRLAVMLLSPLSSNTDSTPAPGENFALIAMVNIPFKGFAPLTRMLSRE